MIRQGIAEGSDSLGGLEPAILNQTHYEALESKGLHAIEARVYCENPAAQFQPCPGLLQHVEFLQEDWLRIDSWVSVIRSFLLAYSLFICHTRVAMLGSML